MRFHCCDTDCTTFTLQSIDPRILSCADNHASVLPESVSVRCLTWLLVHLQEVVVQRGGGKHRRERRSGSGERPDGREQVRRET